MGTPQCITFDLDDTLFDHRRAQDEALRRTMASLVDASMVDLFVERFHVHNSDLWIGYRAGEVDAATLRRERFARALADLGIEEDGARLAVTFLRDYSRLPYLRPGTDEVIGALAGRLRIGCVTDGFSEAQSEKLRSTGLDAFFDFLITSEGVGATKPSATIYRAAATAAGCPPDDIVHVGDSFEKDVVGAKQSGFRAVWIPHPSDGSPPPAGGPRPDWTLTALRDLPSALGLVAAT